MTTPTETMATADTADTPAGPSRARPVFSTADFKLLKTAVLTHLKTIEDSPESVTFSNLYHRLGRLG